MPPSQEATLARVRNNQRRSRARRQDYIISLERKVQFYEAGESPLDATSQSTIRRLERENRRLKSLLEAAGLPRLWMDAYLKLDSENEKDDNPPLQGNVLSATASPVDALGSSSFIDTALGDIDGEVSRVDSSLIDVTSIPEVEAFDSFTWPDTATPFNLSTPLVNFPELLLNPSLPQLSSENGTAAKKCSGSFCSDDDCGCPRSGKSTDNTTACTEAYQMVLQYNSKGVDMLEINIRLRHGFRPGKPGCEGCTVDNKVLSNVLDYISSRVSI